MLSEAERDKRYDQTAGALREMFAIAAGDAPEAVAAVCGISAARIRALAAEIARVAFEEEIELPVPWTDWAGRHHASMRGRPVSVHAMRGISAHSNGFQTCRALHLLQLLLGTIDVPGGWRYKSPHPKPCPPGPKPAGKPSQVEAGKPLGGAPLGYPMGPEDLILDAEGNPQRIDKAFSWEAPIAMFMTPISSSTWRTMMPALRACAAIQCRTPVAGLMGYAQ